MLPWDLFTMSKLEFYGKVNFLKGAITMADFITTVSRRYSQEIQTAEYGFGLEGVLRARGNTVAGILNAVDYQSWNPETDPFIAAKYSSQRPHREGGMQGRSAERIRIACRDAFAGGRHRLALRAAEGLRPDSPGGRPLGDGRYDPGRARERPARVRRHVPPAE